jgi:hypothetical protein
MHYLGSTFVSVCTCGFLLPLHLYATAVTIEIRYSINTPKCIMESTVWQWDFGYRILSSHRHFRVCISVEYPISFQLKKNKTLFKQH